MSFISKKLIRDRFEKLQKETHEYIMLASNLEGVDVLELLTAAFKMQSGFNKSLSIIDRKKGELEQNSVCAKFAHTADLKKGKSLQSKAQAIE